jgi:phage/plasmid-like protein (TIGR03299 family)
MSVGSVILRKYQKERRKNMSTLQPKLAHHSEIEDKSVTFSLVNSRSNPAWHSAANKVWNTDEETPTIPQIMESAKLANWNVRLEDISTGFPQHNFVSDSFLVVRDNPDGGTDVLSTVGSRYKTVQNEELFSFAQNLHDSNPDVTVDSAGSFKNGRVVFGTWNIPNQLVLDPNGANDVTNLYLVVYTSHDGSVAVQTAITPVRVRCQNTLNLAMKKAKQSFKIRHTQTVEGKIAQAREALGLSVAYFDEFSKQANELFTREVTDLQFNKIINELYPKPEADKKGSMKKWENKIDLVQDLYFKSPTNENIKGTAWGVLNTLTERLDYFRTARTGNAENLAYSASGFDPVITAEKNALVKKILTLTA